MKVGSHVIFIGAPVIRTDVPNIKIPVVNEEVYTIRALMPDHRGRLRLAYLEEMVVGYHPSNGAEVGIELEYLREVDLPSALKEVVSECLKQELITKI